LTFYLINADLCPPVRLFARAYAENASVALRTAFADDAPLGATARGAARYSDRTVAEMVAASHARNVEAARKPLSAQVHPPSIAAVLDGCWLQGFADVTRMSFEEYSWLFNIYASEMGDGDLHMNHNYIAREMLRNRAPATQYPAADRRLYEGLPIGIYQVVRLCMALNTARFLPELLGLNLAIEAGGVCGSYISRWKQNVASGNDAEALYYRLHNSIDNFASGHTRWSLAAVQAFMARVKHTLPDAVDSQWRRVWHLWRWIEVQEYGSPDEFVLFRQAFGGLSHESFLPSAPSGTE
jgi:hypothetical protein